MYSKEYRDKVVRRLVGPVGISVQELSLETGVSETQLYVWRQQAFTLGIMCSDIDPPDGSRRRTAEEKLRILAQARELSGEALGAFLRREGIHEAQLHQWRQAVAQALDAPGGQDRPLSRRKMQAAEKRVRELERELQRKDKALAEAAAMLILEKKLQALGLATDAEGGGTGGKKEK